MRFFDVFNGDADGICALIQLRQDEPRESELITGVKRDIALLTRVDAQAGDQLTVLDVSMDKNRPELERALEAGASVLYVDHHFAGEIPHNDNLQALINTAPDVCTSLLVNGHLKGRYARWAVVGAYGDNLHVSAGSLADQIALDEDQKALLCELGTYINYNGYGPSLDDLHFEPADLYQRMHSFADPLQFIAEDEQTFARLKNGYTEDMAAAESITPMHESDSSAVYMLPDEPWARRVSGVFGNDLANRFPQRAHAVFTERADGGYLISVRAPLSNKVGADEICRSFPTGGGRKAAAGVNNLPPDQLDDFVNTFSSFYSE